MVAFLNILKNSFVRHKLCINNHKAYVDFTCVLTATGILINISVTNDILLLKRKVKGITNVQLFSYEHIK